MEMQIKMVSNCWFRLTSQTIVSKLYYDIPFTLMRLHSQISYCHIVHCLWNLVMETWQFHITDNFSSYPIEVSLRGLLQHIKMDPCNTWIALLSPKNHRPEAETDTIVMYFPQQQPGLWPIAPWFMIWHIITWLRGFGRKMASFCFIAAG